MTQSENEIYNGMNIQDSDHETSTSGVEPYSRSSNVFVTANSVKPTIFDIPKFILESGETTNMNPSAQKYLEKKPKPIHFKARLINND